MCLGVGIGCRQTVVTPENDAHVRNRNGMRKLYRNLKPQHSAGRDGVVAPQNRRRDSLRDLFVRYGRYVLPREFLIRANSVADLAEVALTSDVEDEHLGAYAGDLVGIVADENERCLVPDVGQPVVALRPERDVAKS